MSNAVARSRDLPRKVRRLISLDGPRRALLIEAVLALALARLVLLIVPFPRLARRLGACVGPDDRRVLEAKAPGGPARVALARDIGWAVVSAGRHVPLKAECLAEAVAARTMLARRGAPSVLHLGAAKGGGKAFDAHAWLISAGVEVTGFPVARGFVAVACFV